MVIEDEFDSFDQHAVIKVCGVGGGGGNAVNRMIEAGLSDVDFIVINTDAQVLKHSLAPTRLQIGRGGGLGAGAKPEVGRQAAEEDRERVRAVLQGADMVFLALGLGGGTGTGAAPIVAQEASESGALTVAIVTLPFSFEGEERMNNALMGLEELEKYVDTLIVVPNDRISELSNANTSLLDAFRHGDEVLHNGVRAISELITVPGLINLDFADARTVMESKGRALMGIGIAEGENRALRAAEEAINCPLLEQSNINGAKGVIINVRGGTDLRISEVREANEYIKANTSPEARIIMGNVVDKDVRPEIQVTVIAAGFPRKTPDEYKIAATLSSKKDAATPAAASPSQGTPEKEAPPAKAASEGGTPSVTLATNPKDGELFAAVEEKPATSPPKIKYNEEEDLSIPAFLRNKYKNKQR